MSGPARGSSASIKVAPMLLLVCGILMMVGSVTAWVSVTLLGHTISVAGSDGAVSAAIGVNGWITFTGGVALIVLGGLLLISSDPSLRLVATMVAVASLGFAVYDVARILDKLSQTDTSAAKLAPLPLKFFGGEHIGFGLILVLVASVGATLAAVVEQRST
jgi:hypothetical protein